MMKTKNMFWAALSMTAALVMTACSSDDNMMTPAAPQAEVKTIPYSVTVNEGAATNRATVADDMQTLKFATGDKLYISGKNISGVLTLKSGDEGKSSGATFEGDLTYTGDGSPAGNLLLTAALVGTNNKGWNIEDGKATIFSYPNNAYCADVNEAVEEYSQLIGNSTYGDKSFTLTQLTAFLNFEITFEDGTAAGTPLTTVVSNNGSAIATANVTTTTVGGKVVAKFVLPVRSSVTTLSGATVKMGDKEAISFGASQTLTGKVYNVKKTQAAPTYTLLSAATTSDYGKVVCAAGHLHDAKTAVPTGCTAVGILGKVTATGHGLIIALQDATAQNWNTINGWTSVDTYASTTLKVLPDDAARGSLTSYETLGSTAVSNWAVAQKSDYEAIFINLGSTTSYEGDTTYDSKVNAYITTGVGGDAITGRYWSATEIESDFARVFYGGSWGGNYKGDSQNVRPVLAF